MTFPVVWLNHRVWCWDQGWVDETLTRLGGEPVVGFENLPAGAPGAVVVVPARYHVNNIDELNGHLADLRWAVVILTSDEESTFPWEQVTHPNTRLWVQTPRPGLHDKLPGARFLPFLTPPGTRQTLAERTQPDGARRYDWTFTGQVNHRRRQEAVRALRGGARRGLLTRTPGFTQGQPRPDYLAGLADARVCPAPSGPATPDSFRWAEALTAGSVPLADGYCPGYPEAGYWRLVLGDRTLPFPVVDDWSDAPDLIRRTVADWPAAGNRAWAWWGQYRRDLRRRFAADINHVARKAGDPHASAAFPADHGAGPAGEVVTVLIPTSPVASHPDTAMIEETVASVRYWMPRAELVVMVDGVRPEQEHLRSVYEDYQRRLLWLVEHKWGNCVAIRFDTHRHQANMTREALRHVATPLVLFVEHDAPLVTDEPIDWAALCKPLLNEHLDMIRLHHEAIILDVHQYLMVDQEVPAVVDGCPVYRTAQWSQRPHLARTAYYRQMIANHFPLSCSTMIEDKLHSVCQTGSWQENRLAVYAPAPPGGNIKRSLHSDGRGDEPKFDMRMR